MKLSEIMSAAGLSIFPQVGLVIFLAVFISVAWRTFRPCSSSHFMRLGSLPLDDEPSARPDAADEPEGASAS